MANISKLYYKNYFKEIDFDYIFQVNPSTKARECIDNNNSDILKAKFFPIPRITSLHTHYFSLKIDYPGLVTGVGINHEAKVEGEFKLGMHFNYTYGMPVIYGSSVKGVLKTIFPSKKDNAEEREAKDGYIRNYYLTDPKYANIDLLKLGEALFEGTDEKGNSLPKEKRDLFFDAVISQPFLNSNKQPVFLETDSITPHGYDILRNPTPLTFLKIASGVTIEFRFKLNNTTIGGNNFLSEDKMHLFKKILLDFGIGAKTNVGYGQFSV